MSTITSTGRWHYRCRLPDGQEVVADHREPITTTMIRVNSGQATPSDRDAILAWYSRNAVMSANCGQGVCDHYVV